MSISCLILITTTNFLIGLHNSVIKITLVRSVMSLSSLLFVINCIVSYWSWQFSSNFIIDCTCMVSHILVLAGLHHKPCPIRSVIVVQFHFIVERTCTISHVVVLSSLHNNHTLFNQSWQFSILFYEDHTFTTSHNVVLSIFRDRPHPIRPIMTIHFLVWSSS